MVSPLRPEGIAAGTDRSPPRTASPRPSIPATERTVGWYERANARTDYARHVLDVIAPLVTECRSALDVGAGFGALALPLARRLLQVTALEPSPPMAAALRRAVARGGFGNVTVIETAWGGVQVGVTMEAIPIEYGSDQPFDSLDEACEFWATYLGRHDAPARAFLAVRLRREGEEWIAPYRKHALVIQWRV